MRFFHKDSSNFLNGINVLAECTGRGEVIRIDYAVTLRYTFIINVRLADRTYDPRFLKLGLFSDRGKALKIQKDAPRN